MTMSTYLFDVLNPERKVRYYALSALDGGGFGSVWHGVNEWGGAVAIKVIRPTSDFQKDFASWYNDQQVHLLLWQHPHIVRTYDQFQSSEGHLVLVMERAEGSLQTLIDQGIRLSPKDICSVGWRMLDALEHLHSWGVIHRDVTPKNVLYFQNGDTKLSDFGISKVNVSPGELARTFIGYRSYLPPELISRGYSSTQSDIYQTGMVLLSLLIGQSPIARTSDDATTYRTILDALPRKTAERLVPIYGNLAQIISIMLRRRPEWRYRQARDVKDLLYTEYIRQASLG
jgi:serine/threonine-protein kinase